MIVEHVIRSTYTSHLAKICLEDLILDIGMYRKVADIEFTLVKKGYYYILYFMLRVSIITATTYNQPLTQAIKTKRIGDITKCLSITSDLNTMVELEQLMEYVVSLKYVKHVKPMENASTVIIQKNKQIKSNSHSCKWPVQSHVKR